MVYESSLNNEYPSPNSSNNKSRCNKVNHHLLLIKILIAHDEMSPLTFLNALSAS